MAVDALVLRLARLEGAYEQIDKRFGSLESRLESLERRLDDGLKRIEQKLDATTRWLIGVILVNWVTVMLAVLFRR